MEQYDRVEHGTENGFAVVEHLPRREPEEQRQLMGEQLAALLHIQGESAAQGSSQDKADSG